ncbi:MAG: hypothetical protein FJX77_17225, partial [Armatimonadetes bacterium]|nr:hypothetical protein [Armatimonadota bacterium]
LTHFLDTHGEQPCAVYRAPARISLNPHCDHQGAWVPYGLHIRELLCVAAPTADDRVEITNLDPQFEERLSFAVSEEIARAADPWRVGWLPYVEAPGVTASVAANVDGKEKRTGRRGTLNYIRAGVLRLCHAFPEYHQPGLRLTLNGNITQGGGQSSSSALVAVVQMILAKRASLPVDRRRLAELGGDGEWYVGTRGGSGDHAAILLGRRGQMAHLRFEAPVGVKDVRYSRFPAGYELIVANSQTRSDKGAEERLLFNRGVFAYRFAFLALKDAMVRLGMPAELIAETACLGDLHRHRLTEAELYRLVLELPVNISSRELAALFPDRFPAAARGCFGSDDLDRLPTEIPLRGAAVYGLGRVDRGWVMPELLESGDREAMSEFGRLMSVTHDGDRLFRRGAAYTENRDRLSDDRMEEARSAAEGGCPRPLRYEPGFYGASIAALDRLVDVAQAVDGVLGAGLMGAGGGGYVLILAREGCLDRVRRALEREYYGPAGLQPDVETWRPTAAACRLA